MAQGTANKILVVIGGLGEILGLAEDLLSLSAFLLTISNEATKCNFVGYGLNRGLSSQFTTTLNTSLVYLP